MRKALQLLLISILPLVGWSQTILNENITYTPGALTNLLGGANVSGGNWQAITGSTANNIMVTSGSLSYPGYHASGIGNSISIISTTSSAEDSYRPFVTQSTGSTYCAMLVRVTDTLGMASNTSTTGDYFSGFSPSVSSTAFYSRIYIRKGTVANTFQLGIKVNTSGAAPVVFSAIDLNIDSTHLIVFAYGIKTGSNNDSAMLWLDPSTVSMPIAADAKSVVTTSTAGEAGDIAKVFIRQGNSGTPNAIIDGIRIGTTWADIMGTASGPIAPVNSVTYAATGMNISLVNWNRPGDYDATTMQTLVFLKKGSAVTAGIPSQPSTYYVANSDFSANGTLYQNDTAAKCVFNGDSNMVNLTGLTQGTSYYAWIYIVRNTDTTYATGAGTNGTTQTNKPANLTGSSATNISFHTVTFSWSRPVGYSDSNMTILVFMKQSTVITNNGYNAVDPVYYQANPDFSQNGTRFLFDTLAKCVYNGDGTTINISGLNAGTSYYFGAMVVRKLDSNYYSNMSNILFSTTSQPGSALSLLVNGTSQTTASILWARPSGYSNATMTTLVFLKENADPVTVPHPNKNQTYYTGNSDFSVGGTPFFYDTLARCVMNSDSNYVNVTGLKVGTNYRAMVYVVRNNDSVYSNATIAAGATHGLTPPPVSLKSLKAQSGSTTTARIAWSKDSTFVDSLSSVLVYIKKGASIVAGVPSMSPVSLTASNLFGSGNKYENDSNAFLIYKGTDTSCVVNGLEATTGYSIMAYAVRNADSSYATPIYTSVTTVPNSVSSVGFTGQSATSTRISWAKPVNYLNPTYSTLVFIKADQPVNVGTPTRIPASYTVSTTFGLGGRYQNDSLAYTVYRSDTNFVTVSGLIQNKPYHVLIFVVRDADSVYSAGASGMGSTLPPPAVVNIGSVTSTNLSTGNPDSLNVRVSLRGITYGYNQQAGVGIKFLIRDQTGGITVVNTGKNFGYTFAEGDSIEVQGVIGTQRGLIIVTVDTLTLLGSGKLLKTPTVVLKIGENTENDLVHINDVKFLSAQNGNWLPTTYQILSASGADTMTIRLLNTCTLVGTPIPTSPTFNITGMGSQVSLSNVAPFAFNGYQLLPRRSDDVVGLYPDSLTNFNLLAPANLANVSLQGDTLATMNFSWTPSVFTGGGSPVYTIQLDTAGAMFTSPKLSVLSDNSGADASYTFNVKTMSALLGINTIGNSYTAKWRVRANFNTLSKYSDEVYAVTFNRGKFNGVDESASNIVGIYPNPTTGLLTITSLIAVEGLTVSDLTSRVILAIQPERTQVQIDLSHIPGGIYLMALKTASGIHIEKVVISH